MIEQLRHFEYSVERQKRAVSFPPLLVKLARKRTVIVPSEMKIVYEGAKVFSSTDTLISEHL